MTPKKNGPVSIIPTFHQWVLCPKAETRLQKSIEHQSMALVDGVFLTKFYKRLAGLALLDRELPNGEKIVAGHWYTPTSSLIERQLKDSFDKGETHISTNNSQ